jgi:hypothetical protein
LTFNIRFVAVLPIVLGLFACKREEPRTSPQTSPDTVRGVVDSIFPIEEEIRRFKEARGRASASGLENAAASRDELVRRFMRALEERDTAEFRLLAINATEFIDLYYPTSVYSKPPYKQSPELVWMLIQQSGEKGIGRALQRYGGMAANYEGYGCEDEPLVSGDNRVWEGCTIRWAPTPEAPSPIRLFGPIIERDGRFKFVSFANDL